MRRRHVRLFLCDDALNLTLEFLASNTLFRGNTVYTKTMELAMSWYGRTFLESSVGRVVRELCLEKISIEVDPMRCNKGSKELEKNVDLLVHWCNSLWEDIYAVRYECPK
jgi:hypothetical protein